MKHLRLGIAVASTCLSLAVASAAARDHAPRARIDDGELEGLERGDAAVYLGIPYAAPPLGALRWRAPQPVSPWNGVRQATVVEPACPQLDAQQRPTGDEDCLKLSVTAPMRGAPSKPVMVFLHGGGFVADSAATLDATRLASQGDVIVVSMEFRLGVLGYMAPGSGPEAGAYGLLDQRAALRWVQRNIRAFGGDPERVTLFGESGGAVAVCAQLVSPGSNDLFSQAIMQSGSCGTTLLANAGGPGTPALPFFRARQQIHADTLEAARELGCEGDATQLAACLREQPVAKLLPLTSRFASAAVGGSVLPEHPVAALDAGHFQARPVLSGVVDNEAGLIVDVFLTMSQAIDDANLPALLQAGFGAAADRVAAHYPRARYDTPAALWAAVYTDAMFACPQARAQDALAERSKVYGYELSDATIPHDIPALPGAPGGAWHADDLTYLFDQPGRPVDFDGNVIALTELQRSVASDMVAAWTSFARTGRPSVHETPWPAWRSGRVRVITSQPDSQQTVDLADEHHCRFWAGIDLEH